MEGAADSEEERTEGAAMRNSGMSSSSSLSILSSFNACWRALASACLLHRCCLISSSPLLLHLVSVDTHGGCPLSAAGAAGVVGFFPRFALTPLLSALFGGELLRLGHEEAV